MTSIGDRGARRLAWLAFGVEILFFAGTFILALVTAPQAGDQSGGGDLAFGFVALVFPIVGVAILARQPRNAVGWILIGIGLAWSLSILGFYGEFALQRGLPGGAVALALSSGLWAPPIGLMGTVLLLRFPNGRLLTPRWRAVQWTAMASLLAIVALIDLTPGSMREAGYPRLQNPIGVDALRSVSGLFGPMLLLFSLTVGASAVSLVVRFRRSRGIERLQMKWLTTAAAVVAGLFVVDMFLSALFEDPGWLGVLDAIGFISFVFIPVAIGFGVLRYRLYEIDRMVNRTLVYLALTAVLSLAYALVALLPVLVVGTGMGTPPAVVAVATLVAAAMFRPTRRRVQSFIDHRFYRRRYDAQQALAAFAAELREEVDLDALRNRLLRTVERTVQPQQVSVWLRPEHIK